MNCCTIQVSAYKDAYLNTRIFAGIESSASKKLQRSARAGANAAIRLAAAFINYPARAVNTRFYHSEFSLSLFLSPGSRAHAPKTGDSFLRPFFRLRPATRIYLTNDLVNARTDIGFLAFPEVKEHIRNACARKNRFSARRHCWDSPREDLQRIYRRI